MQYSDKPQLFIVTGSNGAGKSTYQHVLLPPQYNNLEVFDGDLFYTHKSVELFKIYKSNKETRKQANEALEQEFLSRVAESIDKRTHFAYEGHFTGSGAWETPKRFKNAGFDIHLIFCGLDEVETSINRVEMRVKKGGFHVSPLDIQNNFFGNMEMLERNFSMFNTVEILDTSSDEILQIGKIENGICTTAIPFSEMPAWFKERMPRLCDLMTK
jgi:predicted ABC-type ATPase